MKGGSKHLERERRKADRLLGLIALKDTWEQWLTAHPDATEIKGEPIDLSYVDELGKKIKHLRHALTT